MKKTLISAVVAAFFLAGVYYFTGAPGSVSKEKTEKIKNFLQTLVAETLEEDYRRHNINISVLVPNITIDKIIKEKHREYLSYAVFGKVSYVIKGKREWHDAEGNLIQLGPESEITHWYGCEIYEDRYGELYKDQYRNRLVFYADNPVR